MISTLFCPLCGAANEVVYTHCFACGQLLVTEKEGTEEQNKMLLHERYQLGGLLGSGGFSTVYRARDTHEGGRTVAIKQINLQGLSSEDQLQFLLQTPARPGWTNPPPLDLHPGLALAGFIVGMASLVFGFIPCLGVLPPIAGFILSCYGLNSTSRKKLAIAGVILSLIAIVIVLGSCAANWDYQGM